MSLWNDGLNFAQEYNYALVIFTKWHGEPAFIYHSLGHLCIKISLILHVIACSSIFVDRSMAE